MLAEFSAFICSRNVGLTHSSFFSPGPPRAWKRGGEKCREQHLLRKSGEDDEGRGGWLKSAGFKSFMRSAKPNLITRTSPDRLPCRPHSFLYILHRICHSGLKYSCLALKNKCSCQKEQKLKGEKSVVLQGAQRPTWQRAASQAAALGGRGQSEGRLWPQCM